jgi:penicillin-binding protein 2
LISTGFDSNSLEVFNRRLNKVTALVVLVFAVLVMRLWFIQIVNGPKYRVQSENNRIHLRDILPFRGMIFDRHGELLVDNRPSYDLYVLPEEIQGRKGIFGRLAGLIDLDPAMAEKKVRRLSRGYSFKPILIKANMPRDELVLVETNLFNLPGIMIQVRPQRHYIYDMFGSHVIGYLGEISETELNSGNYPANKSGDFIGKFGVEGRYQKFLNGFRGGEQVEVDAAGRRLQVISRQAPIPGYNVSLTIDKDLQLLAEEQLREKKGAIVALNPKNGEILAMASCPAFDPNLFVGGIEKVEWNRILYSEDHPLQNRAVSGQYPPGSVFKIVVALAGLEEGILDPQEESVCYGRIRVGRRLYNCWRKHGHGRVDLHKAIVQSCDVYFYRLGRRLGVDKIAHYAKKLGLGTRSGFDLGFERAGLIPTTQWKLKRWGVPWQAGETLSTAIGQSFVLVTPLQMVRVAAAVFNGGRIYEPHIIRWIGKDDELVYKSTPKLTAEIKVNPENMALIKEGLIGVVNERHGTGGRARIKGATVAGKTGTAQVVNLETEKELVTDGEIPEEFRDHAWFVAVAPAEDPQVAVAIIVEHGGHGGSAAAPIAKEMIVAYLERQQAAEK